MVDPQNPADPPTSAAESLLSGTPYRVLKSLRGGAMGEIVEAEHIALRRRAILKIIRREYTSRPGFSDRLRLEAQVLAALAPRTPHVVGVLDFGQMPDGRAYIAMERLQGRSLQEELDARGSLPPALAVTLTRQLLAGLACAHDAGIVHRDIKPSNLFLCEAPDGQQILKILDFGIAKVLADAGNHAPSPLALPTEEGITLGTPRFLAPEQARGEPIDPRSDLYSAGAVLYAMLTGRDPFHHHTGVLAILQAQVCEAPRPPSLLLAQAIPEALDRVVLRALSKRPEDRFASAAEFDAALASATAPAPPRRWAETEPLDVSAFRALRGAPQRHPALPPTEPLDVSMFEGARRAHDRDHELVTTPRVEVMQRSEVPTQPAVLPSVPGPAVAGPSPHATRVLVAVIVATLVATGALLALACGLWLAR